MKNFCVLIQKVATVSQQLTYGHYIELLPIQNIDAIKYYIMIVEKQNLSIRQLRDKIKFNEYERLDDNTKNKLIENKESKVEDFIKNPILIRNKNNIDIIKLSEKYLKQLLLEDLDGFLLELGQGFSYIANEYKIKLGNRYNYIDILLFNYIYNCFVVLELKITELKKEHIGQIETYMNYIDRNVITINQDKTIGIIIVKKDNKFIMEYCSDKRTLSKEYELV